MPTVGLKLFPEEILSCASISWGNERKKIVSKESNYFLLQKSYKIIHNLKKKFPILSGIIFNKKSLSNKIDFKWKRH